MSVNGIGSNDCYMRAAVNHVQEKASETNAGRKVTRQPVNLSISDEGRNMLREMVNKFEPDSDHVNARELTIQNTNEVAWEHYTAMRGISSQTLKEGNYNVEDVMKSIMDTYEARYDEIVKDHENGNREVSYELTGKRSLTLDEDLAGLDEAFKMRLANLEGYITCQQTNKAFENPDSSWFFNRNGFQNQDRKVFHRESLEVSQLSKNREILTDKIKHTVLQSATSFSDMRTGILKEVREEKGQYGYSDIVNACGLSYAKLYSEIEKHHENEQYDKTDGTPLTKEEEIEWLDMQYGQEAEWQMSCARIAAQGQAFQGNISETPTKEIEKLEDAFYQAKNAYMKLYHESKQGEKPLALQNFVFGNSRMYEMLDRLGNLQE